MDVVDITTDDSETEEESDGILESPKEVELSFLPNSVLNIQSQVAGQSFKGKRGLGREPGFETSKKSKLEPLLTPLPPASSFFWKTPSQEPPPNIYRPPKPSESIEEAKQAITLVETQTNNEMDVPLDLMTIKLMLHQRLALCWMVEREQGGCMHGGILADDQGLGKMITAIALIITHKSSWTGRKVEVTETKNMSEHRKLMQRLLDTAPSLTKHAGGTLVVCPAVVLQQWEVELKEKLTEDCEITILRHHGRNKIKSAASLAQYSVVLTTFATLAKETGTSQITGVEKSEDDEICSNFLDSPNEDGVIPRLVRPYSGPLFDVQWFRVILDESQCIKNPRSLSSKAAAALSAENRWCLSGTPVQNSIYDLFAAFRFLQYAPYNDLSNFKELIAKPIARDATDGFARLKSVLKGVLLRRTKNSMIDGQRIVELPAKDCQLVTTIMGPKEAEMYKELETNCRMQIASLVARPASKFYMSSLLMVLKLRQASSHPWLLEKNPVSKEKCPKSLVNRAIKIGRTKREEMISRFVWINSVCPYCGDVPDSAVVNVSCEHIFCHQCVSLDLSALGDQEEQTIYCPECKKLLRSTHFFTEEALREANGERNPNGEENTSWTSSSKLDKLMEILRGIRSKKEGAILQNNNEAEKSTIRCISDQILATAFSRIPEQSYSHPIENDEVDKVLVFSQWTRMLDLMEVPLRRERFQFRRIDGKMTIQQREKAIFEFKTMKEVMVMLISLKSASLGINLSCANHVILMDLWWNPTVEDQAIDRAHRIGQARAVNVIRMTVKDTIDEGILKLQERKRSIVSNTFGGEGGNVHVSGRLTMDDIRFLFGCTNLTS